MTDERILQLFFERNESAIKETDEKYGRYCFKIADNILNDKEDAKECINDAYLKAWESIPPAKPVHFKLFLAKIVRNLSFNRYKSKYADKRGNGELALVLDELEECIAGQSDVEDNYSAKELKEAINEFVRGLPEREGNIFIRRYFYAESISEIAGRYGLSDNYVRVMLNRSRNKLRDQLKKEGYLV